MSFNEVHQVLLDFEAHPGRYPLGLHEPRILFDRADEVLELAVDRKARGSPIEAPLQARLARAARFFVRVALLRQGSDHYTLLGLMPGFEPGRLRDHYRLLIRLTHPDRVAASEGWPADAATRINGANDVLACPVRRREYDRTLVSSRHPVLTGHPAIHPWRPIELPLERKTPLTWLRGFGVWPVMGSVVLLGAVAFLAMAWLRPDPRGVAGHAQPNDQRQVRVAATATATPVTALAAPLQTVVPQANRGPETSKLSTGAGLAEAAPRERVLVTGGEVPPAQRDKGGVAVGTQSPHLVVAPNVAPPARPQLAGAVRVTAVPLETPLGPMGPAQVAAENRPEVAATMPPPPSPTIAVRPSLAQAQPMLMNVVNALQSGRAEDALQWVEGAGRRGAAASAFTQAYNRALTGSRVLRLGAIEFRSRSAAEQLVVDGTVQLHLQHPNLQTSTQNFHLRAYFAAGEGGPVLTQLVSGSGE